MDSQGHPKKPLSRSDMPLGTLVDSFLEKSGEEVPALAKYLNELDQDGRRELGGVLGRFDLHGRGVLDAQERLLARRVLTRLHRPSRASLSLANQVLDYLDLNHNALLDATEVAFCIEILEMFARADSDNDTLSELELRMLYAVLRHLDKNDNHVLDPHEREQLHRALRAPDVFLENQRRSNPLLAELLRQPR